MSSKLIHNYIPVILPAMKRNLEILSLLLGIAKNNNSHDIPVFWQRGNK